MESNYKWKNYKLVYMIQCENGYVHCIFDNLYAAQVWLYKYKASTPETRSVYDIVTREMFSNVNDVGGF